MSKPLSFGSVRLLDEVDRINGAKGLAHANTSYFRVSAGYAIELDTTTGLVTIRHLASEGAIVVPRERVLRFEPLPKAEESSATK